MIGPLLLSALALGFAAPQDDPLQEVIERWDAASAAMRPLRLSFDKTGTPGPCDVEADQDGNVHVTIFPYYGKPPDGAPYREWFLAPRGLHVIEHLPTIHPSRGMPIRRTERLDPAACGEHDPTYFINPMAVQGTAANDSAHGIFLLLLSPRRALAFERELRLVGRRDLDGEPCWVLRAEKTLSFQAPSQIRRFFISVRDHRLRRLDQAFRWPTVTRTERSLWTITWGHGPLPVRVDLATTRNPFEGEWMIAPARRDPPSGAIAPPDDLYATRARHLDVEKLAAASPDDPELLASLALQRGRIDDWKKVAALSPHETPRINLLRIAAFEKAVEPILDLARAIEKDPQASRPLIVDAVRALLQIDRPGLAMTLLDRFGADPPDDIRRLRIGTWAVRKNPGKVVAESLPLILRKDHPDTWINVAAFPDDDVLRELDGAIKAHPDSVALQIVRLRELVRMKKVDALAGALRGCLAMKLDDDQLYSVTQSIGILLRPPGPGTGIDPDLLRPAATDLLAVLDPARSIHLRPLRLQIRRALGEKVAAEGELELLMAAAAKADPKLRSMAWIYMTPDFKHSPLYEEAGRFALEAMKGIPRSTQFAYSMNPFDTPACVYAQARAKADEFGKLFETIYGLDPERTDGGNLPIMLQLRPAHLVGLAKVALETPVDAKDAHDRMVWAGRLLSHLSRQMPPRAHLPETRELFLKARQAQPDSWPALEGLIATLSHDRDFGEAAKLTREALAKIAKSPAGARWNATRLRLILARNLMKAGDEAAARAELERIDPSRTELDPPDVARAAEMTDAVGLHEHALALYERILESGHGLDTDPDAIFVYDAQTPPQPTRVDLLQVRDRLLQGPAGDAAIREWLGRKRVPPSEEAARRAKAALARLSDESIAEREKAMGELNEIGPSCAGIVKEGYESADPEVKSRCRKLLLRWVMMK